MTEEHKKAKRAAAQGLAPLAPEAAADLQALLDRVKEALDAGQDPETVQGTIAVKPADSLWDLHLMEALAALPHPATASLLASLFGRSQDKLRRKALKRALHLLQTRGVPVPRQILPREEARPAPGPAAGPAQAFVSPFFGPDERYVILEGPKKILGGNFLVARISEAQGFREFMVLNLNRQQQKEFWDSFRRAGLEALAVPPAYGVRLLQEAGEASPPGKKEASQYLGLSPRIWAHWGRPEAAPALEALLPPLDPAEQGRYLEQSAKLILNPRFYSWLPPGEALAPFVQKLKEVQESPLVLSGYQKQTREEAVVEEAVQALYPPETRGNWARRLLFMAYCLDLQGQPADARAAQAAGEDLLKGERGPLTGENPFLKSLVQQALAEAQEAARKGLEAPSPSGLILPPTESLLHGR
jgi:hypothetical protein